MRDLYAEADRRGLTVSKDKPQPGWWVYRKNCTSKENTVLLYTDDTRKLFAFVYTYDVAAAALRAAGTVVPTNDNVFVSMYKWFLNLFS